MSELPPDEPSLSTAGGDPNTRKAAAHEARGAPQSSAGKPSIPANDNLIDRTRKVWQPRIGRNLTNEDARQISENVTGFFAVLAEWSRFEMATPANDAGKPVASDNREACDDH
jgi:hypothetical protein